MLSLQHFVMKSEARKLYREVLRALKGVDESTAAGVRQAAREQFADHAHEMDIDRARLEYLCSCNAVVLRCACCCRYKDTAGGRASLARSDACRVGHGNWAAAETLRDVSLMCGEAWQ